MHATFALEGLIIILPLLSVCSGNSKNDSGTECVTGSIIFGPKGQRSRSPDVMHNAET